MKSSFKTPTEILPQSSTYISALTTKPTTSSMPKTKPSSLSVSYVVSGVSVIVLLLLFGLLFFIVILRKRGKTQDPGTTQGQSFKGFSAVHRVFHLFNNYEEIKDSRHLPTSDAGVFTIYSTAQLPTNPSEPSQTDYENVQLPTNPSEPSQTDYENVQLPSNCDFSNSVYSSAQLPSNSPDQVIYSTAQLPTILSDSSASGTQHSAGTSTEDPTYATVNFRKKFVVEELQCPAQSPDPTPTEYLWDELEH
ncbi:uncharacterized protein LOC118798149 [Colossoma macropomum]|uniref:uncharacterized protein LOC118798149 n=1 Tax=Colossoma macropomum TaxID=42526 RepID=UPI00186470DD|nr:uncharacterized protein LOC118798149 [Colossoma macropomum]